MARREKAHRVTDILGTRGLTTICIVWYKQPVSCIGIVLVACGWALESGFGY